MYKSAKEMLQDYTSILQRIHHLRWLMAHHESAIDQAYYAQVKLSLAGGGGQASDNAIPNHVQRIIDDEERERTERQSDLYDLYAERDAIKAVVDRTELTREERTIIDLSHCLNPLKTIQIAMRMNMAERSVRYMRNAAYCKIEKNMI